MQVDTRDNKNDITMQKQACHEFAARQGWEIVAEHAELGVSGFKVSAKDRDAIQDIQRAAAEKKFDILLCFMFDRIGRIDSETPFVMEWFIENGIEVWSVNEGQQRLDSHTDKLLNYIRYWQASGESLKTSIRTKTRIHQIIKSGLYRGGPPPVGYRLVRKGRKNKKGHDLYDIEVNPDEVEIVKTIFEKYVYEGMGYFRIIKYLTENGIFNRSGNVFIHSHIRSILMKPLYVGILYAGEARSEPVPELQIIDDDLWLQAQKIRESRGSVARTPRGTNPDAVSVIPHNTKGDALLAGNGYCGTCGSKLHLSSGGNVCIRKKDGGTSYYKRHRYTCTNKTRKLGACTGQTCYSIAKVDSMVSEFITGLFQNIKGTVESDLIDKSYQAELTSCEGKLKSANKELRKHSESLKTLQGEVVKAINGESKFDSAVLNDLIAQTKDKILLSTENADRYQYELDNRHQHLANIKADYDKLISWADIFHDCGIETKKMIIAYLVRSVKMSRDYEMDITLNVAFEQFFNAS